MPILTPLRRAALIVLLSAPATAGWAQSGDPLSAAPHWTLDTSATTVRKLPAKPTAPRRTPEEVERARREAATRQKFFEDQKAERRPPDRITDFGGYDAQKAMEGAYRPGARF